MMRVMNIHTKRKYVILLGLLLAGSYALVQNDFHILKSLVGYRVPPLVTNSPLPDATPSLQQGFTVPGGFTMSVFSKDLVNPRVMTFDVAGNLLVSETKQGTISLLKDKDKDGTAEERIVLLKSLKSPHGLALYKDDKIGKTYLYIAEAHQVSRYEYDASQAKVISGQEKIMSFSNGGRHTTRTIALIPDLSGRSHQTKLYVSIGSSCDVCVEEDVQRATILESDPDGKNPIEFAGGLRNTVFFALHPVTGKMWGTDMGRDNLGDNLPPDEINIIDSGQKYGWPFCYGKQVKDTKFNPGKVSRIDLPQDCAQTRGSQIDMPAHSAPLGLAFIADKKWPSMWQNHLLVAYHGSWNRSVPTGYKIVKFELDRQGNPIKATAEDFITGWLRDKNIVGRPADIKFGPDGVLYISDDAAGSIYRVAPTQS